MAYAVNLFFDPETELAVRKIRDGMAEALGKPGLSENLSRPHVSLGVYEDGADAAGFSAKLREFAETAEPFDFRLSSLGTFPGNQGVVFLAPVVSRRLLAVHGRFHESFAPYEQFAWPYYLPGNWVPHCTLAMNLAASEVKEAMARAHEGFQGQSGRFQEIGLVEFFPVRDVCTHPLG